MRIAGQKTKTFGIGETAGTGAYRCVKCDDYIVTLTGPEDQLPPCENCDSDEDVRYEAIDDDAERSHGVDAS